MDDLRAIIVEHEGQNRGSDPAALRPLARKREQSRPPGGRFRREARRRLPRRRPAEPRAGAPQAPPRGRGDRLSRRRTALAPPMSSASSPSAPSPTRSSTITPTRALCTWSGRSVWIFLGCGRSAAKSPGSGGWISLDFLGFSRPNRDLSMGYADKTTEEFSYHVPVMWRAARTGARGQGYAKAQDCHGAILT